MPAPDTYKVCTTYADEFRGGTNMTFYGIDADRKAQKLADAIFVAARGTLKHLGLADFSETSVEILGAESQYGSAATVTHCREVVMKIAVKHPDAAGIGMSCSKRRLGWVWQHRRASLVLPVRAQARRRLYAFSHSPF